MRYQPCEYLPYSFRDMTPGFLGYNFGVMLHYRDVIGITQGSCHIMEFYRGKPVLIGLPWKRYKFNRN